MVTECARARPDGPACTRAWRAMFLLGGRFNIQSSQGFASCTVMSNRVSIRTSFFTLFFSQAIMRPTRPPPCRRRCREGSGTSCRGEEAFTVVGTLPTRLKGTPCSGPGRNSRYPACAACARCSGGNFRGSSCLKLMKSWQEGRRAETALACRYSRRASCSRSMHRARLHNSLTSLF